MRRLFLFLAVLAFALGGLVLPTSRPGSDDGLGIQPAAASETDPTVAWYGPFTGQTHYDTWDPAAQVWIDDGPAAHAGGYGHFVWDLHASCCSNPASVYFNVSSPDGVVTGDVTSVSDYSDSSCAPASAGGCAAHSHTFECGKLMYIDVKVDGETVGSMQALHFG